MVQDTKMKEEKIPEDRNMVATIAAEEAFAIPNAIIASEIMDAAADALSPVVDEILGDTVVDVLTELGADSLIELVIGEAFNNVTGTVFGTLFGLTYSAYRCGAFWIAPTIRSLVALICGMLGGMAGSMLLRYVGEIVGGTCEAVLFGSGEEQIEDEEENVNQKIALGAMIGCTLFGAVGAFAGRLSAIKMANKYMTKYFPPKSVKTKKE